MQTNGTGAASRCRSRRTRGQRFVNYWSLRVEIVNTMDADPFSDWQLRMTADLVRHAWSKYPRLVDVVSHAKLDPERRSDPGRDFPWERFQSMVLAPLPRAEPMPLAGAGPLRILGPDGKRSTAIRTSRRCDGGARAAAGGGVRFSRAVRGRAAADNAHPPRRLTRGTRPAVPP